MSRTYRPSDPNPQWLLSPSAQERLPENDLAYFMLELVDQLHVSAIAEKYEQDERTYPKFLSERERFNRFADSIPTHTSVQFARRAIWL